MGKVFMVVIPGAPMTLLAVCAVLPKGYHAAPQAFEDSNNQESLPCSIDLAIVLYDYIPSNMMRVFNCAAVCATV